MPEAPTVTAADIARLAGVGRAAVSNWRKRHADFPNPVAGTAASPEFDLGQVETWLREQGKLPAVSTQDRIWSHLTAGGDNLTATLATIGTYLLARERGESPPLRGLDRTLAQAIKDQTTELGPQPLFDDLWRRYIHRETRRIGITPDDLADLMVALADAAGGAVLDPACGTGALLRAGIRAGCTAVYGQEIDSDTARLTGLWLATHDFPGTVATGDSLRHDAHPGLMVDAVVVNPPFGDTNWGQDELGYDPRWQYGMPPRTEPELAWVQHALAHLRPGGSAVILMPPSAASRRAGRRIRAELLRRGALRAIVALPARAAAPHGVPLHLWVLRHPPSDAPPPSLALLIDSAEVTDDDLTARYSHVLETFRRFSTEPDAYIDEPGFARAVPVIELLDEEVDLTPARRQPAAAPGHTDEHLAQIRERLKVLMTELPELMPNVVVADMPFGAAPTATVAELARTGAVQILGPVRATSGEGDRSDDRPVLTVADVVNGQAPSRKASEERLAPEITVKVGDVVVPLVATSLTARVVSQPGPLLGRNLYLLRPNPVAMDPWFLAAQLRTSANERTTSSLSGTLRFDVRRAQVPRVALDHQRRQGEVLRRLDAFRDALHDATTLGADLVKMTADGLANGLLRPGDDTGSSSR